MSKFTSLVAATIAVPVLLSSTPALAATTNPFGADIYGVANITKTTTATLDYTDTANAVACGDIMEFAFQISNETTEALDDVTVSATLPTTKGGTISSKATITATNAAKDAFTDNQSATVKLIDDSHLAYVTDSTKFYFNDGNGYIEAGAPNGVIGDGLNLDGLAIDEIEFLTFQAQVKCDASSAPTTAPVANTPAAAPVKPVNTVATTAQVTKAVASTTVATKPKELVKTGPASVVSIFALTALVAGIACNLVLRRQLSR